MDRDLRVKLSAIRLAYALAILSWIIAFGAVVLSLWGGEAVGAYIKTRIKFNMGLGLLCSATSLLILIDSTRGSPRERVGHFLALIAFIFGATTLLEYASGLQFGVDELLVKDVKNQESFLYPGRMAPNAAFALSLISLALIYLDAKLWRNHVAQKFAIVSAVIGFFTGFGYLFEAENLYKFSVFIRMSEISAATIVLLSFGILCARPEHGLMNILLNRDPSGTFARRMTVAGFLIPTVLSFAGLLLYLKNFTDVPTTLALIAFGTVLSFFIFVWRSSSVLHSSELMIRAHANQLQTMIDSIPQLAWMTDAHGTVIWYNRQWHEYTGRSLLELRDQGWSVVHDPEFTQAVSAKWEAHLVTGEPWEDTFPIKAADGSFRWFLSRAVPLRDDSGSIQNWFGTNTDITENIEAREVAEKANSSKTQFLANMSHEIRTPIGSIMGFISMLKNPAYPPDEKSRFISIIEQSSEQLLRLIDDILDLSKVEAGKIEIEDSIINLQDFLTDFNSVMNLRSSGKGILFNLKIDGAVPTEIATDPLRLRQILSNIVGNAIKFTEAGNVTLSLSFDGSVIRFLVRDTGPGIRSENVENLFQPFSQADATLTRKFGGTGLGLILSRRLSRYLGGDLVLSETRTGFGSTFEITITPLWVGEKTFSVLPRAAVTPVHVSPPASSIITSEPASDKRVLEGLRVLVVDDVVENRLLIASYLKKTGADVSFAENGLEGFTKALDTNPSVVLMDIQMPVMDGHTSMQKLRSSGYPHPIIALTAHAMREERDRSYASGADGFLTKPIKRETLINALSNLPVHESQLL